MRASRSLPKKPGEREGPARRTLNFRPSLRNLGRLLALAGIIAAITAEHYLTSPVFLDLPESASHTIEYLLFFFPIMMAAIWYGLRGGVFTAILVSALYAPIIFTPLGKHAFASGTERFLELAIYNLVGWVTGLMSEREKRRRDDLLLAAKELQRTQHLASIGQMVSFVAHEIRNPLQNIKLGAELIRMEIGDDKDKVEVFEGIDRSIALLNDTVNELLEYSKPIELNLFRVPLRTAVNQALDAMKNKLYNMEVHMELEQGDQEILVDSAKFTRVLINIISNAADAMPEGGELKIHSHFGNLGGARSLTLSISDNGCGVGEEYLEQVYEPFFTTKPQGTGLGIPICKKIVEAHNGILNIKSKVNEGTTVEITLPVDSLQRAM